MAVIILKKIEKWANFLLSLFPFNSVRSASKLVPIFAPNIRGIALYMPIILFIANTWSRAINRDEDCNAAVKRVPIIRLNIKLFVAFFMYINIRGFSFRCEREKDIKCNEKNNKKI